jgi:hypothetical protein
MRKRIFNGMERDERRAAIGQTPMAFGRHEHSAETVRVRPQLAKPALAHRETWLARRPSQPAQAGLAPRPAFRSGDRPTHPSDEGSS